MVTQYFIERIPGHYEPCTMTACKRVNRDKAGDALPRVACEHARRLHIPSMRTWIPVGRRSAQTPYPCGTRLSMQNGAILSASSCMASIQISLHFSEPFGSLLSTKVVANIGEQVLYLVIEVGEANCITLHCMCFSATAVASATDKAGQIRLQKGSRIMKSTLTTRVVELIVLRA